MAKIHHTLVRVFCLHDLTQISTMNWCIIGFLFYVINTISDLGPKTWAAKFKNSPLIWPILAIF